MDKSRLNKFILIACGVVALAVGIVWFLQASSMRQPVCWNRVFASRERYYWPDGCKGAPPSNSTFCTQVTTELDKTEESAYKEWLAAGRPTIQGC